MPTLEYFASPNARLVYTYFELRPVGAKAPPTRLRACCSKTDHAGSRIAAWRESGGGRSYVALKLHLWCHCVHMYSESASPILSLPSYTYNDQISFLIPLQDISKVCHPVRSSLSWPPMKVLTLQMMK